MHEEYAIKTSEEEALHLKLPLAARMKHRSILLFMRAASRVACILPEKLVMSFFSKLALAGYRRVPKFANLAREHLNIAFGGEKSPEEIEDILRQAYSNQGKNLAEFLMIPHKSADWVQGKFHLEDPKGILKSLVEERRPAVMISAHMGSTELCCAWIGVNKVPMATVVKAQRFEAFTDYLFKVRVKWGTEMIFRQRGVKKECFRQVEIGKLIGLVADQNVASGGVFVDFFGKKAATVTGPADIAMKTGLPVIPAFMSTRNPDDTLTIHVLDPITMRDTGNFDEDRLYNVQLYTKALEDFIRLYPAEYLWWHKRWKTRPEQE